VRKYRHSCKIELHFDTEHEADTVYRSLEVDVKERLSERGCASISRKGAAVEIVVEAQDISALRALLNSYLRAALVVVNTLSLLSSSEVQRKDNKK